ncbi:xylulokinase [Aliagarivorans taiwanensis]|uniref:xylulokinase n=1 Tax=Aliagarivorans taiwanensis TaxID=561966 RepID=UPI0003F60E67|nr:xylulokinase [Aliagarivorans taiwanensis]
MYLGIDCGTQGTKALLWHKGQVIGEAYQPHQLVSKDDGTREQAPAQWFEALIQAAQQAINESGFPAKQLKGIGVSGQQHGLVILDERQQPLRDAILWCDTRPEQALKDFESRYGLNFPAQLGIPVPVAFTLGKLLWVKHHQPALFQRIAYLMLPHDYLNFRLTGNYTAEPGDASGTGFFDTQLREYQRDILGLLDLPAGFRLPELIDSEQSCGRVTKEVQALLGCGPEVIVSSGGGDNMMAAIGTGNVAPGLLTMSLGTSGTVYGYSEHQLDASTLPDLNTFCSSSGGYLPLASTMNVTTANNQLLALTNHSVNDFDQLLAQAPIGAEGLRCLPFFNGSRLPNLPDASGALLGMRANNLSQANLLRAGVEAVSYNLVKGVEVLKQAGLTFNAIRLIGGGAKSPLWRQMLADISGLPVSGLAVGEAGALGAALQACWARSNLHRRGLTISELCQHYIQEQPNSQVAPQSNQDYQQHYQQYHQLLDDYVGHYQHQFV